MDVLPLCNGIVSIMKFIQLRMQLTLCPIFLHYGGEESVWSKGLFPSVWKDCAAAGTARREEKQEKDCDRTQLIVNSSIPCISRAGALHHTLTAAATQSRQSGHPYHNDTVNQGLLKLPSLYVELQSFCLPASLLPKPVSLPYWLQAIRACSSPGFPIQSTHPNNGCIYT